MENKHTFQDLLNTKTSPIDAGSVISDLKFISNDHTCITVIHLVQDIDFISWIKNNSQKVEALFKQHGALLFRNSMALSTVEFQSVTEHLSHKLITYSEPSTPRTKVTGNVYTSTEYPQEESIPLHNEHSYTSEFPQRIWFQCSVPTKVGGQTPVADSRSVYKKIDPAIREQFVKKGVLYVRNYSDELDLPWQVVFGTDSRAEVERYCKSNGIRFVWTGDNAIRTEQRLPAVFYHPKLLAPVWFNQAHLFHYSSLEKSVGNFLVSKYGTENLPRNAYFGDGSEISSEVLDHIRAVYDETQISFAWEKNDLLMLDNLLFAHGRKPFKGTRRIHVAMADPCSFAFEENARKQNNINNIRINTAMHFLDNRHGESIEGLKYKLCAVFRALAIEGLDDGISGHITVRDPADENCFWTNPLGHMFEEIVPEHLIRVNREGELLDGNYPLNVAGFAIHSGIHEVRPDIQCIIHTHSPWGTLFSTLGQKIKPLDQNACMFYENHAIYEEFHGAVHEHDEAVRLRNSLGDANVLVLKNHGTITCGSDIESAAMLMIHIEKAYRLNFFASLNTNAQAIPSAVAMETREWVSNSIGFKIEFDALLRKVERKFPDLMKFKITR